MLLIQLNRQKILLPTFTLTRGTNIETVTSVNGNNKYIWFRDSMKECSALTSFVNVKLTNDNCASMFESCSALTNVKIQYASAMTNANSMFKFCVALTSVTKSNVGDLHNLTNGYAMFSHCHNLVSFSNDLSNLVNGDSFVNECYVLTAFTASVPKLVDGRQMFRSDAQLSVVPSSYPELTEAHQMFEGCNNLIHADFTTPKLTKSSLMFRWCHNLETASVDLTHIENSDNCNLMFQDCEKLREVNITTNSDNASLFTRSALGINATAVVKINGTPIN